MKSIILFLMIALICVPAFAITQEDALSKITTAESVIQEMKDANFSTQYVSDTLEEAKAALAYKDYNMTVEKADIIIGRLATSFDISDSLKSIKIRIDDLNSTGIDTSASQEAYGNALAEFTNENYDRANMFIESANLALSNEEAYSSLVAAQIKRARSNFIFYVIDHKVEFTVISLFILVCIALTYKRISRKMLSMKMNNLRSEDRVLKRLMRKVQAERYKGMSISEETYKLKMDKYKNRSMEIEQEIESIKNRLKI